MDLPEVHGRLDWPGNRFPRRHRDGDVQFVPILPDEFDAPDSLRQVQLEHQRLPRASHGQHDASPLHTHRLGRPVQRKEALVLVGIADLPIGAAQFAGGLDIGKELVADHLDALAVERKSAFGGVLELLTIRPGRVLLPGRQMQIAAHRPYSGGFSLRLVQAPPQGRAQGGEGIDGHGFHDEDLHSLHNPRGTPSLPSLCQQGKRNSVGESGRALPAAGRSHPGSPQRDGNSRAFL